MNGPDAPRRLVVRLPNWLGDVVMALPALGALRASFPDAFIALAGQASVLPVFEEESAVHPQQLVVVTKEREAAVLREGSFDAVLLLTNSFRTAWTARRSGIPQRWGYAAGVRGPLLTTAVTRPKGTIHQSEFYARLVEIVADRGGRAEALRYTSAEGASGTGGVAQGFSPASPGGDATKALRYTSAEGTSSQPLLRVTDATRLRAARVLEQHGIPSGTPLVGFAPGAAYGHAKRWPPDRVARVIARLAQERGARAVVVGAGGDREAGRAIESTLPADVIVLNLIGRTDLRLLMGVIRACRVFVSNDSGAMHLAAALGVPVTAIFGPTNERATAPLGEHDVLLQQVFCRPCMLRECPIDHRCMKRISEADVYGAVTRRMDRQE